MRKAKRLLNSNAMFLISIAFLAMAVTAFFIPETSRLFFSPQAIVIEGSRVHVTRVFPIQSMLRLANYPLIRNDVKVTNLDLSIAPCENTQIFRQESSGNPIASWDIGRWAEDCRQGAGFVWRSEWTVYLFDLIPLRPATLEVIVLNHGNDDHLSNVDE
jgi:hypothetical protein